MWVWPERIARWGDSSSERDRGWPAIHKGNSVFGDQPLARRPSDETRCRPRRPICRADRGSPRACIIGRSGRGGRMAARACEPAGHEGPSASLAPCVRARALRKAKHRPGAPGEPRRAPTQPTFSDGVNTTPNGTKVLPTQKMRKNWLLLACFVVSFAAAKDGPKWGKGELSTLFTRYSHRPKVRSSR